MILEGQPLSITVEAGAGSMTSEPAVSKGLITTELAINALKRAFPGGAAGAIAVAAPMGECYCISCDGGGPRAEVLG
jgi:two-component sensor histidine kinase